MVLEAFFKSKVATSRSGARSGSGDEAVENTETAVSFPLDPEPLLGGAAKKEKKESFVQPRGQVVAQGRQERGKGNFGHRETSSV
jgi:hypothetical protein